MPRSTFRVRSARRQPDPIFHGAEIHRLIMSVLNYPTDIPLDEDTNPRGQNLDLAVYRDARKTLLNSNGSVRNGFHLLNKGITLVAGSVFQASKNTEDELVVEFSHPSHGVADGGHTSRMIWDAMPEMEALAKSDGLDQYIKVDILVGYPDDVIPMVIEGLNSSISVSPYSLINFRHGFDWIKETLDAAGVPDLVSYRQNDEGIYDVRDVLMLLDAMNVRLHPNDSDDYPVRAYSAKQSVLNSYAAKPDSFKWMAPVLLDVMRLYETIGYTGRDRFLGEFSGPGRRPDMHFVEQRMRGQHTFPLIGQTSEYRVHRGIVVPILSAFRLFMDDDPVGWSHGFANVLSMWDQYGGKLLKQAAASLEKKEINGVAKDRDFWQSLHQRIALMEMRKGN